eukprot:674135-Rhodomonas_salina.2
MKWLCGGCVGAWRSSGKNEPDLPWLQALANPEYLDWRRGCGLPLSLDDQRRIETEQALLPVQIHEFLYLADAKSAIRIGRIKYMGITHVLNLAGAAGIPKKSTFRQAGIECKTIEVQDKEGYQVLSKHLLEARGWIAKARNNGGKCLVYCMTGLNVSGAIVAAEVMLSQKRSVLEVVAEGRKKRGNAFLSNLSFQQQLVALARAEQLLGPAPGEPGSVVKMLKTEGAWMSQARRDSSASVGTHRTARKISMSTENNAVILRANLKTTDSFSNRGGKSEEDLLFLEVMRDPEYLDWRQRPDPDTGRVPDEDEQERIEKEQGNLPVQISAHVFLADTRSSRKVGRLKFMGITHVLNVAGPEGAPSSGDTFAKAAIEYKMIDASGKDGYSMLNQHLEEARNFVGAARAAGGKCLVYCMTGYEVSGVFVAADKMLDERMSMLEVLAYCRRRRGNAFLTSEPLLEQWLALARKEELHGVRPGVPGSLISALPEKKGGAHLRRGLFSNSFSMPKHAHANPESRTGSQIAHGIAARHMAARQRDGQNQPLDRLGSGSFPRSP